MDNNNNNIKTIDIDRPKHPKFNFDTNIEKNQTVSYKNNILNRKRLDRSKQTAGGFIAKWFGSGSGLKLI